jgi:sec-independent protein translocase protein TatB
MFDIGMFEMILIGVIALLILGPERMPEAARAAGRWVGKARSFITGIKADVTSQMSVTELHELRQLRNDLTAAQTELGKMKNIASNALNEQVSDQATASETLEVKSSADNNTIKTEKSTDQA